MQFDGAKASAAADQSQGAIGAGGHVRDLRVGVASDAVAEDAVGTNLDFLSRVERQTNIDAAAAAGARVIEGASGGSNSTTACGQRVASAHKARINVSAVVANDAEHLVVAAAGFEGGFDDKVRRRVCRVACAVNCIEQPTARSRGTNKERGRSAVGSQCELGILDGEADPGFVVEVLGDTEAVLPRPSKPHVICRVDRQRSGFGTVVQALPGFRDQAPHLAAGDGPAVRKGRLAPNLALAQAIGVAGASARFGARRPFRMAGPSPAARCGAWSRKPGRAWTTVPKPLR